MYIIFCDWNKTVLVKCVLATWCFQSINMVEKEKDQSVMIVLFVPIDNW